MSRPTRIAVLTCLWRRHTLARATLLYYARMRNALASVAKIHGVAAGSEGQTTVQIAGAAGFHYVEQPNRPLGRKWNAALQRARELGVDAVVIVGSDDWISAPLMARYIQLLPQFDYIGLLDQFMLDASSRRCQRFLGYQDGRRGEPVGVGRVLRSDLLDRLDWKLWPDRINRGLDGAMTRRLQRVSPKPYIRTMRDMGPGCAALDIKTGTNIWSFEQFSETSHRCYSQWTATQHFSRMDRLLLDRAMRQST